MEYTLMLFERELIPCLESGTAGPYFTFGQGYPTGTASTKLRGAINAASERTGRPHRT
jgi:hypothetical protein